MNLKNAPFIYLAGLYLAVLCTILVTSCSDHQVNTADAPSNNDEIDTYLQRGLDAYDSADYDLAQQYFDSAHTLVTPLTDTAKRIKLLFNQTEILKLKGEYDTSLTNYYQAAKLAQLSNDSARIALAMYNIASVNFYLGQYEKCLENADSALNLYSALGMNSKVANCYTVMAIAMRELGSKESLDYLKLALQYYIEADEQLNIAICYNNLGNHHSELKEFNEAAEYYEKAVEINSRSKDAYNMAISCGNLGEAYTSMHRFDAAKLYIDSSLRMSRRLESKESVEINYARLVNYYSERNNADSALIMMDSLLNARTERLKVEGNVLLDAMDKNHKSELSLVESRSEVEKLEAEKARTRLILWFIGGILLLVILASLIIIRKQRKIREIDLHLHEEEKKKLEAERALQEHLLRQREADEKRLHQELDFKRQELMKFSLTISEREDFLNTLRGLVSRINLKDSANPDVLKELKMMLQTGQDDGKTELYRQIAEINQSFVFNLKTRFPKLNEDDIRLSSLLLLDLSSKEIADILSIEAKSVDMKRYRLRKKLELDADTDLKDFLNTI